MMRSKVAGKALLVVAAVVVGYACSSEPTEPSRLCPQPGGEFGAYSCAVLDVQVVGSTGQPLPDVTVGFHAPGQCGCNEFGIEADGHGHWRHTIHRFDEPDSTGDTVTVMVYASATGEQYPQPTPSTYVSVTAPALLEFRPIGDTAVATSLELRLPLP